MLEIILDSILDVAKLLPFLFLTYLFLEWLEHKANDKFIATLENQKKLGPLVGSVLGVVPECGFSSAASSLFETGIISAGTLVAVYLSTSDEMLPILIASPSGASQILPILIVKIIVAVIAGMLLDCFYKKRKMDIEQFCKQEHCDCDNGILKSAFLHLVKIAVWLLVITFLLNLIVHLIGMDTLSAFVSNHPSQAIIVSTLVGMIPSCASSILLSQLFLQGVISFPAICAGLLANAGVGMLVLFRVNKNQKENLFLVGYVWVISLISGLILNIFF